MYGISQIGEEKRVKFRMLGKGELNQENLPDHVFWGLIGDDKSIREYVILSFTNYKDTYVFFRGGRRKVKDYQRPFRISPQADGISRTRLERQINYQNKILTTIGVGTENEFYCLSNNKLKTLEIDELGMEFGRIAIQEEEGYF